MSEPKFKHQQAVFPSGKHYSTGIRLALEPTMTEIGWRYGEHLFNTNGTDGGFCWWTSEDQLRGPETPEERIIANAIEIDFRVKRLTRELSEAKAEGQTVLAAAGITNVNGALIERLRTTLRL